MSDWGPVIIATAAIAGAFIGGLGAYILLRINRRDRRLEGEEQATTLRYAISADVRAQILDCVNELSILISLANEADAGSIVLKRKELFSIDLINYSHQDFYRVFSGDFIEKTVGLNTRLKDVNRFMTLLSSNPEFVLDRQSVNDVRELAKAARSSADEVKRELN
ncbi:MAG: hypothetical protein MRY64_11825 [Hyphomonadaceae bacterium]|nr:hypothetical protein [Hyphomonadaceae bacterium]